MFELTGASAFISSFNPRAEKHGDDNKLAADIKFTVMQPNSALDGLNKELRKSLYRKAGSGEQMDAIEGSDGLVAVKFPRIGAIKWDEEFPGYDIHIHSALGIGDPMAIFDVTLRKFSINPKEGGSCEITFSAICHPDAEEAGYLCGLIQSDVVLTLVSPERLGAE